MRVLFAFLLLASACGRIRPGEAAEQARIIFRNDALEQASVYAAVSGAGDGTRIGTVMSGRVDTLNIPRALVGRGNVVIYARLLARRGTPSTGQLSFHRGDILHVRLPSDARTLVVLPADEP